MTKLADIRPSYCCGCYGQPEGRYVDFEASYDGAVIPGSPANIPVEDLVLCESCLLEAFKLLDPEGLYERIRVLEADIRALAEENINKDRVIQGYDSTVSELQQLAKDSGALQRFGGKPVLQGLDAETKAQIDIKRGRKPKKAVPA